MQALRIMLNFAVKLCFTHAMVDNMQKKLSQDVIEFHLRNLRISGFTTIKDFLSENECEHYLKRLNELYEISLNIKYESRAPQRGMKDKMVYNLPLKDKMFIDLYSCEVFEQILKHKLNDRYYRLLPPSLPNYVLTYLNGRSSGLELELHIDSHIPSPGEHTWVMQVVVVLEDSTIENGCTVVVPGSHISGTYTDRSFSNTTALTLKKGDVAIWDSRLWHGTTENKTSSTRWAIVGTFSSWWVKPAMDYTKKLPQEIYSQLTDKQKCLLGFCSIPPANEYSGINTKQGYEYLKETVTDYF